MLYPHYPCTNYRKTRPTGALRGTVQWIPVIIEEVGRTLHFRTAADHQTIHAVGIHHLQIHRKSGRPWKNPKISSGWGFNARAASGVPTDTDVACNKQPPKGPPNPPMGGLLNGEPKTIQFVGRVSWGNQCQWCNQCNRCKPILRDAKK